MGDEVDCEFRSKERSIYTQRDEKWERLNAKAPPEIRLRFEVSAARWYTSGVAAGEACQGVESSQSYSRKW